MSSSARNFVVGQRQRPDVAHPHLDVRAHVARRQVVQIEDAEQLVPDLDEHPLAESCGLDELRMCGHRLSPVYPCKASTYGRRRPKHATMPTWPSRGGIRCVICSRSTSRSGSSSAPTHPAGRRRSICTRRPTDFVLTAELPGLSRDRIDDPRRGEPDHHSRRAGGRTGGGVAVRAVPPRRARPRPLLARVRAAGRRSTSSASRPTSRTAS